jgi:hypothetical protein
MDLEGKQVDNLLQEARRRLRDIVRAEIASTCASQEDLRDEFLYLGTLLKTA